MSNPNPHPLTREDRVRGGKNGTHGPSIRTRLEKFLKMAIPATTLEQLKQEHPELCTTAETTADAVAMNLLAAALKKEAWAIKLITEQIDGKAKETINHQLQDKSHSVVFEIIPEKTETTE